MEMKVTGVKELMNAMKASNLTPVMEKQVFRPGLREGAKKNILPAIKAKTPVDVSPYAHGEVLRKLIKGPRAIPRSRWKIGVRITITAEHAAAVELGTKPGSKSGRGRRGKVAGQRFMRAGLYESEAAAMATVIKVGKEKLPGVIAKHARKHRTKKR